MNKAHVWELSFVKHEGLEGMSCKNCAAFLSLDQLEMAINTLEQLATNPCLRRSDTIVAFNGLGRDYEEYCKGKN